MLPAGADGSPNLLARAPSGPFAEPAHHAQPFKLVAQLRATSGCDGLPASACCLPWVAAARSLVLALVQAGGSGSLRSWLKSVESEESPEVSPTRSSSEEAAAESVQPLPLLAEPEKEEAESAPAALAVTPGLAVSSRAAARVQRERECVLGGVGQCRACTPVQSIKASFPMHNPAACPPPLPACHQVSSPSGQAFASPISLADSPGRPASTALPSTPSATVPKAAPAAAAAEAPAPSARPAPQRPAYAAAASTALCLLAFVAAVAAAACLMPAGFTLAGPAAAGAATARSIFPLGNIFLGESGSGIAGGGGRLASFCRHRASCPAHDQLAVLDHS